MTWVKIDEHFRHHPKAIRVGPLGRDLFICGLQYCNENLTDGFIPDDMVAHLAPGQPRPAATVAKLLAVSLWTRGDEGYHVHDYLRYNPSRDEVLSERQYNALKREMYANGSVLTVVRERDGAQCRYCRVVVSWKDRRSPRSATFDHVDPVGGNTVENLVVACRSCNSSKRGRTPEQAGLVLLSIPTQNESRSYPEGIKAPSRPVPDPITTTTEEATTSPFGADAPPPRPARATRKRPGSPGAPPPEWSWPTDAGWPDGAAPTPALLAALYNRLKPAEFTSVTMLTDERNRKAARYLHQFPEFSFWRRVFEQLARSEFLRGLRNGDGHASFRADFDWLLTVGKDGTENAVKVAEGKYDDEPRRSSSPAPKESAWRGLNIIR